ncbi:plexin-B2-like isoform X1 [Brienomyrus brachyistius]|uniref:plexin-B2-like isoform X1 n=2 Tax=Brienomyrus brachyistius TaxID=42636 RepID=UPI0020B3D9C9|nr:plexin-B2-like isoform X1 [Brienomyrus brachyistius]
MFEPTNLINDRQRIGFKMASWTLAALLLSLSTVCCERYKEFVTPTPINNVVQDPRTGRIYLGAVNAIYQLNSSLEKEKVATTGPKKDDRQCTPPIQMSCAHAKDTNNTNKLLLVNSANDSLIVCGSLFRGLCSLLNLSNVEQPIYYNDNKGEKTYVASIEETVSVVGVMANFVKDSETLPVFVVGKGYGSQDSSKLISTRILQDYNDWVIFENIVDASGVQATPFITKYLHNFRYSFKENGFLYFFFTRTRGESDNKNYTFISRLCENDQNYYSYIELQLNCSQDNKYNKAQTAYITSAGEELANNLSASGQYGVVQPMDKVLFVVSSTDGDESDSALCMYPLNAINNRFKDILRACYLQQGYENNKIAVDSPYSARPPSFCSLIMQDKWLQFDCGADFLPSPLASAQSLALTSDAIYETNDLLTAVAVAVENQHTVAFLGTSNGEVKKLHLPGNQDYHTITVSNSGDMVNKNLLFDTNYTHLYITTKNKISKVPVQACHLKKDCQSCMALRDPYCGWCVLEGRCTRKSDCERAGESAHWLWSPTNQCVEIESFQPPNLSCKKGNKVAITMKKGSFPTVNSNDNLKCKFGSSVSQATIKEEQQKSVVTCMAPALGRITSTSENPDFMEVPVTIFAKDQVELTSKYFTFYDCSAAPRRVENTPCISCVTSAWKCQWKTQDFTCSDSDDVQDPYIIKPGEDSKCPRFEKPEPNLISVGMKTPITFTGVNLQASKDTTFKISTELMKPIEEEVKSVNQKYKFSGYEFTYGKTQTVDILFYIKGANSGKKIDSQLNVTLYNCSMGREDCSLCKSADPKYNCVWCTKTSSCLYRQLCPGGERPDCPGPTITEIVPRYGPLDGGISVTIKGSNLGIRKEDIDNITVAGIPCVHQQEKYSVSTSVVCEIGSKSTANSGHVEVQVKGGKIGRSQVLFTYRDPKPERIEPLQGPQAGGTVITIYGTDLDTGSKEDLNISIGGAPCTVETFNKTITCKTGKYNDSVPSDKLMVKVCYGKTTKKPVPQQYRFLQNPKVDGLHPGGSFYCGGRKIMAKGSRFGPIQKAKIVVEVKHTTSTIPMEYEQEAFSRNDTELHFFSPTVNKTEDIQSCTTYVVMDNIKTEMKFKYHSDPIFDEVQRKKITENSIISVTGSGFARAMTAKEAEAFLGDAKCVVNTLQDDKLFLDAPTSHPTQRDTSSDQLDLMIKFGHGEWVIGSVEYGWRTDVPFAIIIPAVITPMLLIIIIAVYCYRRKSQQAEREYEKVKHQLENLEESVRDRCKKEFTDLMIEMDEHTSDLSEGRIPFLDYKTYTDRVFFLPSKDGAKDVMITGKLDIPDGRKATVTQALNQFSNLLNSKPFLINFIRTLEARPDFNARARGYFASLLTVALHGKLEYYTDIMRTLLLELMEQYVRSKNPKLMLRRSETVVERMLCNWMSICLYQFLKDSAGEPLYKLFKAIKHQVEKGPIDAVVKKAKYTLNDTGLLGDDVEYCPLTLQVLVHGEGPDVTLVKVLNCDTISQVKEKIIDQVYKNLPYSQRPKMESVTLEWRPGSTGQILSDLDLTSQKEGRWRRMNTLAHYNVRDNATLVLSKVLHPLQSFDQHQDSHEETNNLLDDDKVFHLVRPMDDLDEVKKGSKEKSMTKAITELYLTRLLSVKGTLQKFVDDFFRSVLCSGAVVPPAVKYFFDFLDEQAQKHDNVDDETIHIWKTNSLPLRFWVNILKNPHFIFDVHVSEVVDASLSVIAQTFMDACTKSEHKLSRDSPSNKLLYAKEISTYKKMVDEYYKGIRQMISVSDQDMNTHLAEVSRSHTDKLNTQVALHQLYQYASKYYDVIITSLDEDPAAQNKQLTLRLQQIAAALENKVTDL